MVIAMDANALAYTTGSGRGDGLGASEELDTSAQNEGCVIGDDLGELGHAALESFERKGYLRVDAGGVRDEVAGGEGLGDEGWIVSWRGKGEMHLGSAAAKQRGGVEVQASVLASQGRRFPLCKKGDGCAEIGRRGKRRDAVVVVRELVEGPLPAVPFVFHQPLQHGDCNELAALRL